MGTLLGKPTLILGLVVVGLVARKEIQTVRWSPDCSNQNPFRRTSHGYREFYRTSSDKRNPPKRQGMSRVQEKASPVLHAGKSTPTLYSLGGN
jgi:hypothetical protein